MKTCGLLMDKCLEVSKEFDVDPFLLGLAAGQVEKVYLGACKACMFRTLELKPFVEEICRIYGLYLSKIERTVDNELPYPELWIFKFDDLNSVFKWKYFDLNSPDYHLYRGLALGVKNIDLYYHLTKKKEIDECANLGSGSK